MTLGFEQYHRELISGRRHGPAASLLRGILLAAEPAYTAATWLRNRLYDRGLFASHRVGRPVVSIGNITTGGTGKTPVVRWLAECMIRKGRHPAILLRGYRGGDEKRMLQNQLPLMSIEADPDRVAAAKRLLDSHPEIDLFILDDGFQHRRIHRDFDLVLIDASNPFGFDHMLPRGLLRESLSGLARADAFLITHAEMGQPDAIEPLLRRYNPSARIYRCRHVLNNLPDLHGKKIMTFSGIGNPSAFDRQIESAGAVLVCRRHFDDHHHYRRKDLSELAACARRAGAEMLITTEKDWIKIGGIECDLPIHYARLSIRFEQDGELRLIDAIESSLAEAAATADSSLGNDGD